MLYLRSTRVGSKIGLRCRDEVGRAGGACLGALDSGGACRIDAVFLEEAMFMPGRLRLGARRTWTPRTRQLSRGSRD